MSVNPLAADSVKDPATSARPAALPAPRASRLARPGRDSPSAARGVDAEKLRQAALQFEAVFLRQLLKTAKFAGNMTDGGYGGMVVDALASGVSQRGGLGLAQAIIDAVQQGYRGDSPKREQLAAAARDKTPPYISRIEQAPADPGIGIASKKP